MGLVASCELMDSVLGPAFAQTLLGLETIRFWTYPCERSARTGGAVFESLRDVVQIEAKTSCEAL
jgi:hypothetical protein